jgi:hypothetical protein
MRGKALVIAALILGPAPAVWAQQAQPAPRADAWGSFGWVLDRQRDPDAYRTNGNRRVAVGIGAGWYWASQFKLDVDTNTPSRAVFETYDQVVSGSQSITTDGHEIYDRWGIGAVQSYEFLSNAWFTPYAGVGVDVLRETRHETIESVFISDTTSHTPTRITNQHDAAVERRTRVRPLAAVGFKAYMTRRAFFRTDARVAFRNGVDDVRFRLGFGVDF